MDENAKVRTKTGRYARFFEWVDDRLIPVLGPPAVGPYGVDAVTAERLCTVCGHALSEHAFDRSSKHDHFMYCPVSDRLPDPSRSAAPVNELGMVLDAPARRSEA